MNQRNSLLMVVALGLGCGLVVMLSILLGGGNEIAAFYQYLLVMLFIAGFAIPRGAFVFWLVLCGYTDLMKRFMVVTGRVSSEDLYYVLGIPPLMIGAITLSVVVGAFSGRFRLRKLHWMMLAVSCGIIVVVTGLTVKNSGASMHSVLPVVANSGLYFILIFLVPALFQTTDEVLKLLRLLLWAYLPVALYGIFQQIYGYRDFEIAYLKSGLSIEIKQLFANEIRAFSTLNSTTALATVCAALFSVSVILPFLPHAPPQRRALSSLTALLMAGAYLGGVIASTGRAAASLIAFSILAWLCFRSKRLIIAMYALSAIAFITLVFSADRLLANMSFFQDQVTNAVGGGQKQFMTQMTRVGTYSDRLMGFSNLAKNPDVWTFFGHRSRGEDDFAIYSHDILTSALIHYGVVPVALALLFLIIGLVKAHRQVLRIHDPQRRNLAAALQALALSFLVLSLLAGNVLVIFPINVFACLFCGMMLVIFEHDWKVSAVIEEADVAPVSPPSVEAPPRLIHRFARSGRMTS